MAIVEVVKYDGSPDVYAWKYPNAELGTWTQLIVNNTQEALLFKGGKALDLFGPGRHTLSTLNIPILNQLVNIPFGGRSPFSAEVWFVNKQVSLDVKWGTASPIQLQDPKYNIVIPVRAFGQFGIVIEDSRQFLSKLVGTLPLFNQDTLSKYLRGMIMMNINELLSSYLVFKKVSLLEINAYIGEISKHVEERVGALMHPFGIRLVNFFIDSISTPEDDASLKRLRDALARKAEMDIIGYNYQQERTFDTLEGAAKNEGSSQAGVMGAALGLSMGAGIGGIFGSQFGQLGEQLYGAAGAAQVCPSCQSRNDAQAKFCNSCGKGLVGSSAGGQPGAPRPIHNCDKCGMPHRENSKFCGNCGDAYKPCPSCGADCADDAVNCSACGETLPRPCRGCGEQVAASSKFCPHCGTNNSSGSQQCPGCRHEVQAGQKFCPECGHGLAGRA